MPTASRRSARPTTCPAPVSPCAPTAAFTAALASALFAGLGTTASAPAHAQAPAAHAVRPTTTAYSIPAGPLEPALTAFAKTSGVLLAYTPDLVQGRSSPGLQGNHAPPQALSALLAGTGLLAVVADNGTYTLRRAPAPGTAPGAAAPAPW